MMSGESLTRSRDRMGRGSVANDRVDSVDQAPDRLMLNRFGDDQSLRNGVPCGPVPRDRRPYRDGSTWTGRDGHPRPWSGRLSNVCDGGVQPVCRPSRRDDGEGRGPSPHRRWSGGIYGPPLAPPDDHVVFRARHVPVGRVPCCLPCSWPCHDRPDMRRCRLPCPCPRLWPCRRDRPWPCDESPIDPCLPCSSASPVSLAWTPTASHGRHGRRRRPWRRS